ncbi:MAG: 4Fe-4S binding protein [Victivallales bacterium]|nr:4Fe-4S binding protein [Victivallales bacterium]
MKKKYIIDRGCTSCDECRGLCPVKAISMDLNGAHIDLEKCIGCGICINNCPSEAIRPIQADARQQ